MGPALRRISVLVISWLAAAGCARLSVRDADLARLEAGEIDPGVIVLTVHGMLFDLGFPWDYRLRDEIAAGGRLAAVVTFFSEPSGVWLDWGARAPARLVARLADAVETLHSETACAAPVRLRAVGFSAGCEAILDAASRMERARFDRVLFLNPSSFAFSGDAPRLIEERRIGRLLVGWSPFDLVTLFAPLGAGALGLRAGGEGIENRCLFNAHVPPLFASGRRRARALLLEPEPARDAPEPAHTCAQNESYRRALARLLREERTRSR